MDRERKSTEWIIQTDRRGGVGSDLRRPGANIEIDIPREGETDSDDSGEYERQLSVAIHESWESFYNSGLNLSSDALPTVTGPARGAETEYERQLNVAIQESLKSFNNSGLHLNSHALRTVTGPARGNIGNDSVMELTNTSHCPNEDSVDEGAQTEALDAVRGTFINCSSDSDDTGRKISDTEPKKRRLNATITLERSSGSGVGGSLPTEPTSASGQASGANAVGHQTDMVVPFLEPMVCVTNRNPMDLTIEEAKKYMRTE
ncbi:hypothetical protein CTI12_AA236060 [Artemisia annua]|uniref:Uncharacterized protein n=1 Tax=Artemisia annua TaxID=35608 RepID=A0A2U1NSA4_ARTAN|nr:hypothetical protein CTI12_AA236060 [Artemisia annua]